jgi:hypothetical protein
MMESKKPHRDLLERLKQQSLKLTSSRLSDYSLVKEHFKNFNSPNGGGEYYRCFQHCQQPARKNFFSSSRKANRGLTIAYESDLSAIDGQHLSPRFHATKSPGNENNSIFSSVAKRATDSQRSAIAAVQAPQPSVGRRIE